MAFPRAAVSELMAAVHRRCCICHRFCGVKIETDHIVPRGEGGTDEIDNAIAVCFECHAEIHSYNDAHPRGRKFQPEELRSHRDQWLRICRETPEVLVSSTRQLDVGPIQALVDELQFNERVAGQTGVHELGCLFRDQQFGRAIQAGAIAVLQGDVQEAILAAYVATGAANQLITAAWQHAKSGADWSRGVNEATRRIQEAAPAIQHALGELLRFVSSEDGAEPDVSNREHS